MPTSLAMADRCDAALRVGGASEGTDKEDEFFKEKDCQFIMTSMKFPRRKSNYNQHTKTEQNVRYPRLLI